MDSQSQPESSKSASSAEAKIRGVSGVFPRLGLTKVIELVSAIYAIGEGERVKRIIVFNKMGKNPIAAPVEL